MIDTVFTHKELVPLDMKAEMVEGKRLYLTPSGNHYPSVTTVTVSYTHLTLPTKAKV